MIIGHLGKDPVNKIGELGNSITTFAVATDASYIDRNGIRQEQTEWIHVVCFNRIADNCAKYLHKSSLVYVEGSLQTRKWLDQENNPKYITEIRAQKVIFLDKKPENFYDNYRRPQDDYLRQNQDRYSMDSSYRSNETWRNYKDDDSTFTDTIEM